MGEWKKPHATLPNQSDNLPALIQKMADIIGSARIYVPSWAQQYMPSNVDEMERTAATWLRTLGVTAP